MLFPRFAESMVDVTTLCNSNHLIDRLTVEGDIPDIPEMSSIVMIGLPSNGVKRMMHMRIWEWVGLPFLVIKSIAHIGTAANGPLSFLDMVAPRGVGKHTQEKGGEGVAYTDFFLYDLNTELVVLLGSLIPLLSVVVMDGAL